MTSHTSLSTLQVRLQYQENIISNEMSLDFSKPEIISIIGPNGSGKSTLLKALCRLLPPSSGGVYLNGRNLSEIPTEEIARTISILPQSAIAPGDMTIRDLTAYGRLPYQSFFSQLSADDKQAIDDALSFTELTEMQHRRLDTLSGGERQRAWLAMALAQHPRILLLDEPTTYLDIHHQLELMELVLRLHQQRDLTVIMVLHDLNHAARYSQRLIALKKGTVVADGSIAEVFTVPVLENLYDVKTVVTTLEQQGCCYPICFPYTATKHS